MNERLTGPVGLEVLGDRVDVVVGGDEVQAEGAVDLIRLGDAAAGGLPRLQSLNLSGTPRARACV